MSPEAKEEIVVVLITVAIMFFILGLVVGVFE